MVPEASRSMLVWFWIAVATEVYTSSNHIWLLVFDDKTIPYGLFSTTSIPRAIIYVLMARKLSPVRNHHIKISEICRPCGIKVCRSSELPFKRRRKFFLVFRRFAVRLESNLGCHRE